MKALSDLVVIDLTHMLSGPFGGMILADLGARTIKVEPPGKGELTRGLLAKDPKNSLNGMGAYFLTLNRNKESVCIDLKSAEGLALFYELVKKADIVLSNFSPGVTARLKIDYDALSKVNERIITCTVTGFGESGPQAPRLRHGGARLWRRHVDHRPGRRAADARRHPHRRSRRRHVQRRRHARRAARARAHRARPASPETSPQSVTRPAWDAASAPRDRWW